MNRARLAELRPDNGDSRMKNNFRFFNNAECGYFPCHKTDSPERFNCLFCYCPLYFFEECGGQYSYTKNGVKDCTACLIPHAPKGYDHILKKLRERLRETGGK